MPYMYYMYKPPWRWAGIRAIRRARRSAVPGGDWCTRWRSRDVGSGDLALAGGAENPSVQDAGGGRFLAHPSGPVPMDLRGRAAIVTGGARGIGRGIALELARTGADVCVNYRGSEGAANRAVRELVGLKSDAFALRADVTKPREAKGLVDRAAKRFGRLDILVNNVGDFLVKRVADMSEAEWRHILESNLTSMFLCTKAAIPHLRKRKWGRIVNIACAGAYRAHGTATMSAYYAAKAGVVAFTKALAREEGRHRITANAVAPGIVEDYDLTIEEAWKSPRKEFAIPRSQTASDVAHAVAFLCSEEAGFVTGNVLSVTGGWLL